MPARVREEEKEEKNGKIFDEREIDRNGKVGLNFDSSLNWGECKSTTPFTSFVPQKKPFSTNRLISADSKRNAMSKLIGNRECFLFSFFFFFLGTSFPIIYAISFIHKFSLRRVRSSANVILPFPCGIQLH